MMRVEKLCRMKARAVDVKVNVPLFKIGSECFQQTYFRIKETKSALPLPHYKKWGRARTGAPLCLVFSEPFVLFYASAAMLVRMAEIAFFSRRDTCACEMPTSSEISVCVLPSK